MKTVVLIYIAMTFCVLLCVLFFAIKAMIFAIKAMIRKKRCWQERKQALSRMTDDWFKVYYYNLDRSKVKRREKKFINQEIKRRKLKLKFL